VLAFSPAVYADQLVGSQWVVIPEAIWAAASGGGTWVTQLQIHAFNANTPIYLQFFYQNTNSYRSVTLTLTGSANTHNTLRYSNILQTMGTIDTAFDYYGKVGALLVFTTSPNYLWAHAMTVNGNYGKTMPSWVWNNTENTAAVGRWMAIPGIQSTTSIRTGCGFWNSSSTAITVSFFVMNPASYNYMGSSFQKTIQPWGFISFNPFTEAGLSTGYSNSWLLISPDSGGGGQGMFGYGSLANNITNDTYALTAIQ
jgi:hypothetical protein